MDEAGELERRLRALGRHPIDPGRSAQDLTAIAALARPPAARTGFFASKVRVAAAFLAGLLVGSTGLAAADVLPDPAQHVAHRVLAQVGVDVPDPDRYHGPECGPEPKRNHGAYVRDDHALAQSDCGKKVRAGGDDDAEGPGQGQGNGNGGPASDDPCRGRPPWAGKTSMTPDEVAAAKAARAACPDDDDAEVPEVAERQAELAPDVTTTTVVPAPATTEATTTTTTEATTTTTATP